MKNAAVFLGIDVGGTNLKAGLTDEEGRVLATRKRPLGTFQGAEHFAASLAALARETALAGGVAPETLPYIGIGIPGAVSEGTVRYTCNIPLENVPLERLIRQSLDVPVLLENDANCAAVGEWLYGAGRGRRDFAVITLGTGVGGGFILDGRLYSGGGMVGEVGHMVICQGGVPCTCGRRGCWEMYASATGLIRLTKETMAAHLDSLLHPLARMQGGVDGRTAFEAAQAGDEAALLLCRRYVEYLAAGLTNLANILQPEAIALGGGVSGAPDALLLNPLREILDRECYARHGGRLPRLVKAELGNDAGLLGAAQLGRAI